MYPPDVALQRLYTIYYIFRSGVGESEEGDILQPGSLPEVVHHPREALHVPQPPQRRGEDSRRREHHMSTMDRLCELTTFP